MPSGPEMLGLGFYFFVKDDASLGLQQVAQGLSGVQAKAEEMYERAKVDLQNFERRLGALGEPRVQAGLRTVGMTLIGVGGATMAGLGLATKGFASFEQEMLNARSVAQWTEQEYQKLSQWAIQMSSRTRYSAEEIARSMYEVASAGVSSAEDIQALTEGILKFAAAGKVEASLATQAVVAGIKGFRLEMEQASHVADVFTWAVQLSMIHADELNLGMSTLAGVAGQVGQSIESATAALMAARNVIGSAQDAGTSLRAAFMRLMAATNETFNMLRILGIQVRDSSGNFKQWPELIREFQLSFAAMNPLVEQFAQFANADDNALRALAETYGLTIEQARGMTRAAAQGTQAFRDYILANVFGQDAIRGVVASLNAQAEVIENGRKKILTGADALLYWRQQLEQSAGAAEKAEKTQMKGLEGGFIRLRNASQAASHSMIEPVKGLMGGWAPFFAKVLEIVPRLPAWLRGTVTVLTGLGGAGASVAGSVLLFLSKVPRMKEGWAITKTLLHDIGGLLGQVKLKMLAQAAVTGVVKAANLAWAAAQWLVNTSLWGCPIIWIIAGVAALVAGIVLLIRNWDRVVNGIKSGFRAIVGWFSQLPGWATILLAVFMPIIGIPLLFLKNWDKIIDFLRNLPATMAKLAESLYNSAKKAFGRLWDGVKAALGIHSPSYIERALMSMRMTSLETVTQLQRDFGRLDRLAARPTIAMVAETAAGGPARTVPVMVTPSPVPAVRPAVAAAPVVARAAGEGPPAVLVRQPVILSLDGRTVGEAILEFLLDYTDRQVVTPA